MAKNEIVEQKTASLPAFMLEQANEVAGLGNSTSAADNTLPFLGILQSNSPQVEENKPEYIEGAKKGMIFNTATKELYDGKVGLLAVPFAFQKALVEWVPRSAGGGYVAQYVDNDPILRTAKPRIDPNSGKPRGLMLPNGNDLVETAYTFLLVEGNPMPVVLGATSTALKPMRDWMTLRNQVLLGNKQAPAFAKKYRLQTVYQENEAGSWYNWKITADDWVDQETWDRALSFARAAAAGEMVVGRPPVPDEASPYGDDGVPV